MIVPTKGVHPRRALLTVGGQILGLLGEPRTVSSIWSDLQNLRASNGDPVIGFDWFVLALDLVHSLGGIDFNGAGLLQRSP